MMSETIFVPCEFCQREGRILQRGHNVWEERDAGPCPECRGECVIEVAAQPVTLEDICPGENHRSNSESNRGAEV
jgi:hypothetical protein